MSDVIIFSTSTENDIYIYILLKIEIYRFCSGLKGRWPFWLRGVPSLLLLEFSFSGDEEVE